MDKIVKYIQDALGVNLNLVKVNKEELKNIPFYILNAFNVWKGKIFDRDAFLLEKLNHEQLTPLQYEKQQELLEKKLLGPVIFVIPEIKAYDRKRLVQKKVNFIIQDKQMFIPQLLIDLKEYHVKPVKIKYLQPSAQVVLLYHFQRENLNELTYKQIAGLLGYPYLKISRALENLTNCNLCKTEGKKEKTILFHLEKQELWNKALEVMRSPFIKQVYINTALPATMVYKSNMNALAFYTDLNDDGLKHYAVSQNDFTKLKKNGKITETSNYDGDYIIEIWRYEPGVLTDNEYVDPLSLYLAHKDDKNERIGLALEQIIKKYLW
jgi:hypothetical protein